MNIIDFRFRPNTPEIIDGIRNSNMFRAACKAIGFDARQPQPLDEIVEDLDRMGVELGVITGRDSETTYGSPTTGACFPSAARIRTSLSGSGESIRTRAWPPCGKLSGPWRNWA